MVQNILGILLWICAVGVVFWIFWPRNKLPKQEQVEVIAPLEPPEFLSHHIIVWLCDPCNNIHWEEYEFSGYCDYEQRYNIIMNDLYDRKETLLKKVEWVEYKYAEEERNRRVSRSGDRRIP